MKKFFSKNKIRYPPTNRQIKSMQCTVTIDADTLTTVKGSIITLTTKIDPPGTYDVNFKANEVAINLAPITTDNSGMATLPFDTTNYSSGLYDLTIEVINPTPPPPCVSSPLTVAITTNVACTGISITNPSSPVTAYIGDIIPVSVSATITEPCVAELRVIEFDMRIGSCILYSSGNCIINTDTADSPPGTYHIVAHIGSTFGYTILAPQCISPQVEATLQVRPGKIIVLAIPPGARIYIDDEDIGVNASAIISDISINTHTIRLTLPGYNDFIYEFTMTESGETYFISTIMTPTVPLIGTGSLNVTSTPSEAEFFIYSDTDEIANAMTPTLEPITDIPAGIYGYEAGIAQNGVSGAMGSVTIKAGETTNLHIPLPSYSPDNGIIAIESIPVGADIYIDGEYINAKTSFATSMSPDLHTYELRMAGYQNKSGEFTVVTGNYMPAIVSDVLQPSESGTAMIFAAVGIAALGMMLSAPSSVGIKEELK